MQHSLGQMSVLVLQDKTAVKFSSVSVRSVCFYPVCVSVCVCVHRFYSFVTGTKARGSRLCPHRRSLLISLVPLAAAALNLIIMLSIKRGVRPLLQAACCHALPLNDTGWVKGSQLEEAIKEKPSWTGFLLSIITASEIVWNIDSWKKQTVLWRFCSCSSFTPALGVCFFFFFPPVVLQKCLFLSLFIHLTPLSSL